MQRGDDLRVIGQCPACAPSSILGARRILPRRIFSYCAQFARLVLGQDDRALPIEHLVDRHHSRLERQQGRLEEEGKFERDSRATGDWPGGIVDSHEGHRRRRGVRGLFMARKSAKALSHEASGSVRD